MAYASAQDIIAKYGEEQLILAADHDQDGFADDGVVEDGLTDASNEIDTYVAVRHTLPLNPVHPILKPLCIDIALYKMSVGPSVTDEKRKRYEDALSVLKLIAEGKLSLGQQSAASANSGGAFFTSNPRLFGRGMED